MPNNKKFFTPSKTLDFINLQKSHGLPKLHNRYIKINLQLFDDLSYKQIMTKKNLFTYPAERYLNVVKKGYKYCN